MIHYFGLGFIQLKINFETRMHFYSPELPQITSNEDVHNHRYDFESCVLKGELEQELFHVINGDTHLREQESCQAGVHTESTPTPCATPCEHA